MSVSCVVKQGLSVPRLPDACAGRSPQRMGERSAVPLEPRARTTEARTCSSPRRAPLPHGLRPDQRTDRASRRSAVARRRPTQRVLRSSWWNWTRRGNAASPSSRAPLGGSARARRPRLLRAAPEGVASRRRASASRSSAPPRRDAPSARGQAEDVHAQARRRPVVRELVCELDVAEPTPRNGPVVAIDRGIANFGADVRRRHDRQPAAPRSVARSASLTHNAPSADERKDPRTERRPRFASPAFTARCRRQRDHFLHVQSARLAKSHGVVVLEKLNVAGMIRDRCARSIADAGWSRFAEHAPLQARVVRRLARRGARRLQFADVQRVRLRRRRVASLASRLSLHLVWLP